MAMFGDVSFSLVNICVQSVHEVSADRLAASSESEGFVQHPDMGISHHLAAVDSDRSPS